MDGVSRVIFEDDEYSVVVEDTDPYWQWFIFRGDDEIQNGVSLTERSACDAGKKVLLYLQGRVQREVSDRDDSAGERRNDL